MSSSPYREAFVPDLVEPSSGMPRALATYDVSGVSGDDAAHGRDGSDGGSAGAHGHHGTDAGPAVAGQHAGTIRLELVENEGGVISLHGQRRAPAGDEEPIRTTVAVDERGFIALRALGGDGGRGGNGGRGGDGATGSRGSDATRWSRGSDGGDGGHGGQGGDATSGEPGGDGGTIIVACSDEDTPLLMLIRHDISGGSGGAAGRNGAGGNGGAGGRGGSSHSWTTTSSYRDSQGNSQTRTHYHSNPGGSSGSRGHDGATGRARVEAGAVGAEGTYTIEVKSAGGTQTYASRYDLRLVAFSHDSLNEDCVYEPGEIVRVFGIEVENAGGMPTPAHDELELGLVEGGWVNPEPGELKCVKGLAAGARHQVPGELRFRIGSYTPRAPAEPLEVEESILHRALLPSVRRGFEHYQEGEAYEAGRFVIRFPARLTPAANLRSLAAGEATRVRFAVVNQSRFALGASSACKRVLRVRVSTAEDSDLDDEHVGFGAVKPSAGWTKEIDLLEPGETAELELTVDVRAGAPEYRRFAARITLELGALDEPATVRTIQLGAFDIRVARPFAGKEADLLLVVNHKTTREEIEAWEAVAARLAFKLAIWDLTRERHLDLEAPLKDDLPLVEWFKGKAIAILDNEIDGPDGPIHPHSFLASEQALRAAAAGIDIGYFGKGPELARVLVPPAGDASAHPDRGALVDAAPTATRGQTAMHRRYWLRWWAKPAPDWLERKAHALSDDLHGAVPEQRHIVVHRFAPELESKFLWMKRWKVGTLETVRTLDAAAGAIVHLELDDATLHAPACAASDEATTALLVMFDFQENLDRLGRMLVAPDATDAALDQVIDALLLDLANEIAAVLAPGGGASRDDLVRGCPRLAALAKSGLAGDYDSVAGKALIRLAGRLWFFAQCQVAWWEKVPPLRWLRRGTKIRGFVARMIDDFLAGAFGEHNAATTLADARIISDELAARYTGERKSGLAGKRRAWSLELARVPIASQRITSDTELLANHHELVLSADEYDTIAQAATTAAKQREQLVAAADRAHADLRVA